jgi:hypothetical protein
MKAAIRTLCLIGVFSGMLVGQQTRPRTITQPIAPTSAAVKAPEPYGGQQQFEYLVRYLTTGYEAQSELNKLGAEGWEMVASLPPDGNAKANLCYFKRPVAPTGSAAHSTKQGGAAPTGESPAPKAEDSDKPQPEAGGK